MICRLSDLPIELKDKSANPEVFTAGKDAKSMLHKHLDTLSSLGRFAKGLTASTKKTAELPKTFIGSKGTIGKNDERVPTLSPLSKSMKGIIHWENENYETNNEISPQPMDSPVRPTEEWKPADAETLQLSLKIEDLMGSRHFAGGESQFGQQRDMVGKFLLGVRAPPTSKADEEQKGKDENLIERYLARMKIPAVTQVEIEEKRRDEELLARYLSEVQHVSSKDEEVHRKDDCDMLLRHFGMFGMKNKPADAETLKLSLKIEDFLGSTQFAPAESQYGQHRDMVGKFLLGVRAPPTSKADEEQKGKDDNLIERYLARMKIPAVTQVEIEEKRRDEELLARYLSVAQHVTSKDEEVQRKDDCDMLLRHFGMFGMQSMNPEDEQAKQLDEEKTEIFMSSTVPTLKEETLERRQDNEWLAKIILHKSQTIKDPETIIVDKKNEDFIFKALNKFK